MAEFKIDGRMTVRTLKDSFKKEFEGTLRVYNGKELADENATLASIRKDDAKGGELVCRASRTVGKFEQEMKEVFGIRVQVASPDDYVLALDGITLANLKNIKKYATKADMEELVAYRRKDKSDIVEEKINKTVANEEYVGLPIFDFKFKKINWELNEENIEEHREEIDNFGVIFLQALSEDGDFKTKVIAGCDIADALYDAMEIADELKDDGWDEVEVYYTTVCEIYGAGKSYEHGQDFGYVISSFLRCDKNWFIYGIEGPSICRAVVWNEEAQSWLTNDCGDCEREIYADVDMLIENIKADTDNVNKQETTTYKFVDFFTEDEITIDYGEDFNETVFIGPLNEERWELAKENVTSDFYASCKKLGWDIEHLNFTEEEFFDFFDAFKEAMEDDEDLDEVECKGISGEVFLMMAESIAKLYFCDCIGEAHFDVGGNFDFTFEFDLDNEECLEGY